MDMKLKGITPFLIISFCIGVILPANASAAMSNWTMDINANSTDTYGYLLESTVNLGANTIATDGYDGSPFDIGAPPTPPTNFEIYFWETDASFDPVGGKLSNNTKAAGISKNWTLMALAPRSRTINITWSCTNIHPNIEMQIQEFDINTGSPIGSPVDMKSWCKINFTAGSISPLQKGYIITASSIDWSMDIFANSTDTFGNLLDSTVNLGENAIAADGYDGSPFDIGAPPTPPTNFEIYFSETDASFDPVGGKLSNNTKGFGISKNWTLMALAPKSRTINITWSCANVPSKLMMQMQEFDLNTGYPIGSPVDMRSVNLITFTAGSISPLQKGYKITASSQISYTMSLSRGWNMVSLPVNVSNASVGAIFGSNVSTVYGWTGSSYATRTTLEPKNGYWALSGSNYNVTVTGTPVLDRNTTVSRGWNMVGPVTSGVTVSSLPCVTTVYGWSGSSYISITGSTNLTLTKGYWMLANATCTIRV